MAIRSNRTKYNNSNVNHITEQQIMTYIYTYIDTSQSIQNDTCQVVQQPQYTGESKEYTYQSYNQEGLHKKV